VAPGVVVPIPTLPPAATVSLVMLLVSSERALLSLVPRNAVVPNELPPCTYERRDEAKVEVDTHCVEVPVLRSTIPADPEDPVVSLSAPRRVRLVVEALVIRKIEDDPVVVKKLVVVAEDAKKLVAVAEPITLEPINSVVAKSVFTVPTVVEDVLKVD
jgi:hypothetical protein